MSYAIEGSSMASQINFENIVNFRNFAEIKTRNNRAIKADRVYRSALLDFASPQDLDQLINIAPDVVFDFRMPEEKHQEQLKLLAGMISYQAKPIDVGNFFTKDEIKKLTQLTAKEIDQLFITMYQAFPQKGAEQFKAVFEALSDNERVIYHCSAGKDRTGVMSYLLLSALDVHYDDIMTNYLRSNESAEALHQLFSTHKEDSRQLEPNIIEALEPILRKVRYVEADYLNTLDQFIKQEYGGPIGYIEKVLQVDIVRLQKHLIV